MRARSKCCGPTTPARSSTTCSSPQPTAEAQDLALYRAIARAGNVVLATTEIGARGRDEACRRQRRASPAPTRRVAAADFRANSSGVIQQYPYTVGGLDSVPVATAEVATGHRRPRSSFRDGSAWIDFPGPGGNGPQRVLCGPRQGTGAARRDRRQDRRRGRDQRRRCRTSTATSVTSSTGDAGPGSAGWRDRHRAGRQPAAPGPAVGGA